MDERTDQALIEAALKGNRHAYELLVKRYQDAVYGLALSMTRSHSDAADMTQEAFVRAFTRLHQYNPKYAFKSWLLRICANQTKNLFRKRMNRRKLEEDYHTEWSARADETPGDHEELEAALGRLPAKLSAPLRLKYMEGMAYDEVAAILGIGVSAAKMRVLRARNQLAEMLNYEKA